MEAVITMENGNGRYQMFRIFENGKGEMKVDGQTFEIPSFADFFISLCNKGWRKVAEMEENILAWEYDAEPFDDPYVETESQDRKGMLRQLDGFRQEWNAYMGEVGNNQEYDFCLS